MEKDNSLNLELGEGTDETVEEGEEEEVKLSAAELKRLKGLEKSYKDSQKEGQLWGHLKKTKEDNAYLVTLAEKDRKMAESVADFYGMTLDVALSKLWAEVTKSVSPQDLKQQIKEAREQEKAEDYLSTFISDKKLSGWFLEDFQQEFDDYMEGKKRTVERVEKATRYALWEVKKVSKFAEEYKKIEDKRVDIGGKWGSPEKKERTSAAFQTWKTQNAKNQALRDKHNLLKRDN